MNSNKLNFNDLEERAKEMVDKEQYEKALRIYYYMAYGDPSLDGGWLGWKIGICYERLNQIDAARYWYGRAVEENPEVREYVKEQERMGPIDISDLVDRG
jgi:tetratricopeptide (TPR) repeat protein